MSCRFFDSEGTSVGVASPSGDIKPPLSCRFFILGFPQNKTAAS